MCFKAKVSSLIVLNVRFQTADVQYRRAFVNTGSLVFTESSPGLFSVSTEIDLG